MFFLSLFAVALAADSPCPDDVQACPEVRDVDREGGLWLGGQGGVIAGGGAAGAGWGGVAVTVRADALFSAQLTLDLAPDRSISTYKAYTTQPAAPPSFPFDRSPIRTHSAMALRFTPLHGVLVGPKEGTSRIGLFGLVGAGAVLTNDAENEFDDRDADFSVIRQVHPTLELGFGADIRPTPWLSVELEGRRISYLEQFVIWPSATTHRWLPSARALVRI